MDDVLNSLKQKLGEEFLEKKQNRVKKPRQQRTAPTTAQQRQADARKAEDAKRQLKAQVKQEIKSGFQGPRPVPLLKLVKDALDFLSKAGGPVSREALEGALNVTLSADPELAHVLHRHAKIKHREGVYEYVYQFKASNKEELLLRVQENPMGVMRRDLRENYATVDQDIASLREDGYVYVMQERNKDQDEDLVFPRDRMGLEIDAEVLGMWRAITDVPRDAHGLQQALTAQGLKPSVRTSQRKIEAPTEGDGKKRKRAKRGANSIPIPGSDVNLQDQDPTGC